jgi:acetyl esterase/lipase
VATSAFHPDLRRIAAVLPRSAVGPKRLPALRALQRLQPARRRGDIGVGVAGAATVRIHRPPTDIAGPAPALLWIHGGGYVMGRAAQEDRMCRTMARALRAVVAAVDYRLAPEHPFPVPLHDCHDALVWLAADAQVDPTRIAIGGSSAGGGLAAALALLARERDEVQPSFQLLAYPMLDDRTAAREGIDDRHVRLWNNAANHFGWRSYLGGDPGGKGVSSLAAPARAENLSGLPSAWIGVGSCDLFLAEDVAYAHALRGAGVPCDLLVEPGAFHGFDIVAPSAAVSRRFRAAQVAALAAAFRVQP